MSADGDKPDQERVGVARCAAAFALILLNGFSATIEAAFAGIWGGSAEQWGILTGYVLAATLAMPLTTVGLFQFGARFRNPRSRIRIFNWTSLATLFTKWMGLFAAATGL